MRVADIILDQMGGNRFICMTGSKDFISDGNTLRMTLTRNQSKANRLYITLDADDTYTMRFFRYTSSRMRVDHKKGEIKIYDPKITEIKTIKGVYCDMLQEIFTDVTGLYTRF